MKRVLITGVTGFAGTNLVRSWSADGDMLLFGHSRSPDQAAAQLADSGITLVPGLTAAVLDEFRIDAVIHLAGIAHDLGGKYVEADYERVNHQQTAALYDAFLDSRASRFVFVSSIKAVAAAAAVPLTEDVVPQPDTWYGQSKRRAEEYIIARPAPAGKEAYIVRPCMIHGPGNKGNLNLLYQFVRRGLPYPFGAFDNRRNLLSIGNFVFALQAMVTGSIPGGIYHLADAEALSTVEMIRVMADVIGRKGRVWMLPKVPLQWLFRLYNPKMLEKLTADMLVSTDKLERALGGPLPVTARDGLRKTIRSFLDNERRPN